MKKGICCAGNMIVDITYPIETWPKQNELTHITEGIQNSTGGAVCNTITDLARLDPKLHLVASGLLVMTQRETFFCRKWVNTLILIFQWYAEMAALPLQRS